MLTRGVMPARWAKHCRPPCYRGLTHEEFTVAEIEDILAGGRAPDWIPLIDIIRADPYGEVAEKIEKLCERSLFGAPVFRRVLAAARQIAPSQKVTTKAVISNRRPSFSYCPDVLSRWPISPPANPRQSTTAILNKG